MLLAALSQHLLLHKHVLAAEEYRETWRGASLRTIPTVHGSVPRQWCCRNQPSAWAGALLCLTIIETNASQLFNLVWSGLHSWKEGLAVSKSRAMLVAAGLWQN